jgi:hypothetical protein
MNENLPEGVLRSSPLPMEQRSGTRLFLSYENGWYRVHTRFENFAKRRTLAPAAEIYESILLGIRALP